MRGSNTEQMVSTMWRMARTVSTHVVLNSIFPEIGLPPSQHAMPYPPSSSDITGRARSGPAGNAHSVVANAILKEIAGAFVTVPLSVAKEASRARQIVADDGVNSWKFHIGANYIGSTDKIIPFTKKIPGTVVRSNLATTGLGCGFIFFIFIPIWGRFPIWLIFFKWVETTN